MQNYVVFPEIAGRTTDLFFGFWETQSPDPLPGLSLWKPKGWNTERKFAKDHKNFFSLPPPPLCFFS